MSPEKFAASIQKLEAFYTKRVSKEQGVIWYSKLVHLSDWQIEAAVESVTSNERYFPTPAVVLDHAERARATRKSQEVAQENGRAKRFLDRNATDSDFARECRELTRKCMDGQITGLALSEAMFDLARKYPGKGMAPAAVEVYNRYAAQNGMAPLRRKEVGVYPAQERKAQGVLTKCETHDCEKPGLLSPYRGNSGPWYCKEHF